MDITAPEKEIHQFVLRVACGEEGLESIYRWLRIIPHWPSSDNDSVCLSMDLLRRAVSPSVRFPESPRGPWKAQLMLNCEE